MTRIQVKTYKKIYMTRNKGEYTYKSYYIYLSKEIAEPLVGKELKVRKQNSGILIEPILH